MNGPLLQPALRELQAIVARPRIWIVFAALVGLLTATGPFGTLDRLALPARLGYWLIVLAGAWAIALAFVAAFHVLLEGRIAHVLPRMLIGAAIGSLPIGAMLTVVNAAFLQTPMALAEVGKDALTALPMSLAMCLLAWLALDDGNDAKAIPGAAPLPGRDEPATLARPAILDRLPAGKRGKLVRLEVQDHYVLVVTAQGREMVLMRLADAIRETAPVEGIQVHRSHWIARDGIGAIRREPGKNGRTVLAATDGARIPVSRERVAAVRALAGDAAE